MGLSARVGPPRRLKQKLHIAKATGAFSRECVLLPHEYLPARGPTLGH